MCPLVRRISGLGISSKIEVEFEFYLLRLGVHQDTLVDMQRLMNRKERM
jgi:hypothetical protein